MTSKSSYRDSAFNDAPAVPTTPGSPEEPTKQSRMHRILRGPAPDSWDIPHAPYNVRGARLRTSQALARAGGYAPAVEGAPSTTRQAEILNTAVLGAPTGHQGIVHGVDMLSNTMVVHDPFVAYNNRRISSTNTLVAGDIGSGKSAFLKTVFVLRPLTLQGRRVVVFDKKTLTHEQRDRGVTVDQGEYAELARTIGTEPLTFDAEGTTRLNLLDPNVLALRQGTKRQIRLLATVAGLARDGHALSQSELRALRSAYLMAQLDAEDSGRVPVVGDLARNFAKVVDDPQFADLKPSAKGLLHQASIEVRYVFENLLDEYGSVLDGETSEHVDLNDSNLTVFDLSQMPDDGPGVSILMAVANMWLMGRLRSARGMRTYQLIEEGWHALSGPSADFLRSNTKLQRSLGLSLVIALHKFSEIKEGTPAEAVLQEAQSVHCFRTTLPESVERTVSVLGLGRETALELPNLPTGVNITKIGNRPEIKVRNLRSTIERQLTDTDVAMRGLADLRG